MPPDDDARAIMLASLDDDDITPLDGATTRPPRGHAQRGSVSVALDSCAGEFVSSDKPTVDPWDLAIRKPKWAGMFKGVGDKMTSEKRLQVLLVDDDRDNRIVGSIALTGMGFDVTIACEGNAALGVLSRYAPDVIMLDLRMPGMDGWEFLSYYDKAVPVVVVSAYADDRPLPEGLFAVLSKPVDMREVAVVLRQAARSTGRLQ